MTHCQHLCDRPPFVHDMPLDRGSRNAQLAGPSGNAHGFAVVCQHAVSRSVSSLFKYGRPSAVLTAVVAVVVNAVDRVIARRTLPHVLEKTHKTTVSPPSITHGNATAAIPVKLFVAASVATGKHSLPDRVFRAVAVSVRRATVRWAHDTFAAPGQWPQFTCFFGVFAAALASHMPETMCAAFSGRTSDGDAPKDLSCEISGSITLRSRSLYTRVSHCIASLSGSVVEVTPGATTPGVAYYRAYGL